MNRALRALYRRLGRRYLLTTLVVEFSVAHFVVAVGVLGLSLFVPMTTRDLLVLMAVAQAATLVENVVSTKLANGLLSPVRAWLAAGKDPARAPEAWRALAALPADYVRRFRHGPVFLALLPFSIFAVAWLGLRWSTFLLIFVGGLSTLAYGLATRFFLMELGVRPVLEDVGDQLPDDFDLGRAGVPLETRLLVALPVINIGSGITVATIAVARHDASLADLGVIVLTAIVVAFTVSLGLSLLLVRSIVVPVRDLRAATERVAHGELDARVPVLSTDETGRLAQSFNAMVRGLAERERLHEAFGAYVDPGVAERVLRDGPDLAGDELEVTVLFLDIRDFTSFAERASPQAVVSRLNEFYELVVPVLARHGGMANKFIGDGLLAIFGAPERRDDHAECAVEAALALVRCVRERHGDALRIGVGINSGPVVAGTIGGGGRMEFTVIGDTVNTAARVEAATRSTGDDVLITDATRARLRRPPAGMEERPPVPLKGKRERVRLWAVPVGEKVAEREQPAIARGLFPD